jgi:predicted component of type VI protein secretion system
LCRDTIEAESAMPSLIVQTGKHKGKKIELPDREVVIGRDESCFIRMTSNEVSRQHCSVSIMGDGLLVRDLQSQNGTLVNDVRIDDEKILHDGDLLQVGPVQFEVAGTKVAVDVAPLEDDIFGWLSADEDTSTEIRNTSDTTIIKPTGTLPKSLAPRKKFESVAEEARDIIRRHQELQAQKGTGPKEPKK